MKLLIDISDAKEINRIPYIRELIVLSYIVNSIDSMRDQYIQMSQRPQTPASNRDAIYGMIQLSALSYEAMNKANSVIKKLANIVPTTLHSEIAWLHSELKSPLSFYNEVLAPIRNELGFHFSHSLANLPLHKCIPHVPPILAETDYKEYPQLIYVLPTEIISSFLLSLISDPANPAERVTWIIEQLGIYSNRIGRLIRDTIYAIIEQLKPKLLMK